MLQFNILIADDDREFVKSIELALKDFSCTSVYNISDVKSKISIDYDAILLDLVFDETQPNILQGLDLIPYLHNNYPDLNIIVMTNYASTDAAVAAIKYGAKDFLNKKELDWIEWKNRIENYCKDSYTIRQLRAKSDELELKYDETELIGISDAVSNIRLRLKDLAQNSSDITIFLSGETGTGKNLAVKYFRKHSVRRNKPFKEFSISELSETVLESELFGHVKGAFTGADYDKIGLFEEANGGILFLDEIGDYDVKIQKKIMRFLEDKTITPVGSTKSKKLDLQLILATNRDLQNLVSEGKFREDLYYRINVAKIELPPLRERIEDIRILADYFFKHFKEKEKTNLRAISEDVYKILEQHEWKGNVRELYYAIQTACTKARLQNNTFLEPKHLPDDLLNIKKRQFSAPDNDYDINLKKAMIELEAIEKALAKAGGKKSDAAKMLGLSLDQMRYKIKGIIKNIQINLDRYPHIKLRYFK